MKRNLLRFFLSLIVVSAGLTWVWFNGVQIQYALMFKPAAQWAFRLLGIDRSGITIVVEHFTNLIPFIALTLALPDVAWKNRLIRLIIGLAILAVVHFILIVAVSKVYSIYSLSETAYKFIFPMCTINDALPLALWFLFFSNEIIAMFRTETAAKK